jgi:hypothetical protein
VFRRSFELNPLKWTFNRPISLFTIKSNLVMIFILFIGLSKEVQWLENGKLTGIELFAFPSRPSFLYKPVRSGCWYVLLKLTYQNKVGYGGCEVPVNGKGIDLIKWGACLRTIRSCAVGEIPQVLHQMGQEWPVHQLTLMQHAVYDLAEAHSHRSKIAAGAARHVSLRLPSVRSNAAPRQSSRDLVEESAAYYSILCR